MFYIPTQIKMEYSCKCKAVKGAITITAAPSLSVLCHCLDCRLAHAAPLCHCWSRSHCQFSSVSQYCMLLHRTTVWAHEPVELLIAKEWPLFCDQQLNIAMTGHQQYCNRGSYFFAATFPQRSSSSKTRLQFPSTPQQEPGPLSAFLQQVRLESFQFPHNSC